MKLFEGDFWEGVDEIFKCCDFKIFIVVDLLFWVWVKFSDKDGKFGEFIFVFLCGIISDGKMVLVFSVEMNILYGFDGVLLVVFGKLMVWVDVLCVMWVDGMWIIVVVFLMVIFLFVVFER